MTDAPPGAGDGTVKGSSSEGRGCCEEVVVAEGDGGMDTIRTVFCTRRGDVGSSPR